MCSLKEAPYFQNVIPLTIADSPLYQRHAKANKTWRRQEERESLVKRKKTGRDVTSSFFPFSSTVTCQHSMPISKRVDAPRNATLRVLLREGSICGMGGNISKGMFMSHFRCFFHIAGYF